MCVKFGCSKWSGPLRFCGMGRPNQSTTKAGNAVLSNRSINQAMRTVHVRNAGRTWLVKKVADAKIWRFSQPNLALAKAVDLAKPESYRVVVHDNSSKGHKIIRPEEFGDLAKLAVEFRFVPSRSSVGRNPRHKHRALHLANGASRD